eukprot:CAMPEP_0114579122 /NCGR_PEP_ID=MMETSP0125-20121206/3561_1 /TAXON_ID=485358 ORGANISM="Aristerostoma sp., Strain ATCC 50986" /NCGR_SAMPLE_ID=MMETSP0125 /ASSEMBLY_ACC=CAM_ASM_000245 /LENGTH=127 /DNA_ID=CAMNT_0001769675 /DNA_START=82 /DNA_END=465 /DNA_ORIENTATION=+
MVTQLIEHERIKTTLPKAELLRKYAEKMIAYAKREDSEAAKNKIKAFINTEFAKKKLVMEIAPRFKDKPSNFTRIVHLGKRRGDNAPMAYIEYIGNEIDKYEQAMKRQDIENGVVVDKKEYGKKLLA